MILFSGLKGMVRFIMGGINDAAAVKASIIHQTI